MLQNLVNTLETCKAYHEEKGNTTKAKIIEEHIEQATVNDLGRPLNSYDSLYDGQGQ